MLDFLKQILTLVPSLLSAYQLRSQTKLESELRLAQAVTEAKIKAAENGQYNEAAWELKQIENAGWKDEFLTLIISIPLIMCFVPGWDIYVYRGFGALEQTPEWYQYSVMLVIGASFGYRKAVDFIRKRKK